MRHKNLRNKHRPQILCNELVRDKFRAVVSGYGLDVFLVGQQTSDCFGQQLGLLPMGKFGHEEHVCGTLHDCEYGVVVRIHNQIHLKIPKALSVCLIGTLGFYLPRQDAEVAERANDCIIHTEHYGRKSEFVCYSDERAFPYFLHIG